METLRQTLDKTYFFATLILAQKIIY